MELWNNKIYIQEYPMEMELPFVQQTDSKSGASIKTITQIVESNAFVEFKSLTYRIASIVYRCFVDIIFPKYLFALSTAHFQCDELNFVFTVERIL